MIDSRLLMAVLRNNIDSTTKSWTFEQSNSGGRKFEAIVVKNSLIIAIHIMQIVTVTCPICMS